MGVVLSCPFADFDDLDSRLDNVLVRSMSLEDKDMRTALRSVSFNGRDSEPATISFRGRELNTTFSFKSLTSKMENEMFYRSVSPESGDKVDQLTRFDSFSEIKRQIPLTESGNQRLQAAVKLQKVYKSFRTRRQLADCAIVVEQKWWKLLDFAELKRSSISFFDIEKPETAISRWSRARTRAAKVGKGLSKDAKARKLALQHWLEAIDPRHRYGHNLQFYYVKWLHCQSEQPFFYWLDIGEGKEVNLDRCPRSKLQQQCIKYLGPTEREMYEVVVENGKFAYKQSGKIVDTTVGPRDAKWIFVLSTSKTLYVGLKKKGTFQHSSFLAGGATLSAGRLVVEDGVLKAVWPHSGHYLPTEENFQEFKSFLREQNIDLTDVKESPQEEEEEPITKKGGRSSVRYNQQYADLGQDTKVMNIESLPQQNIYFREKDSNVEENTDLHSTKLSPELCSKITKLEIPNRDDMYEIFKKAATEPSCNAKSPKSPINNDDGYDSAEDSFFTEEDFMFLKMNLFDEDQEEEDEEAIPKEKIMKRINSHKEMKSYQLANQLSSKWTTGAGPRIGCMRDYPSELQLRVLEHVNLSPRFRRANSTPWMTSRFSPKALTPTSVCRETIFRSSLAPPGQVVLSP
ncbi:IQ domain-containing protein IQM6 [Hevea brasiliensis]|uniref:IQ domain-containing protein IQM6 n=1 Tax=Hevea brasiliensis TaxID=3981 RepID=UPI0025E08942|nr:IQ domain-containing protein IQM6 [Hevea brasiliensis]